MYGSAQLCCDMKFEIALKLDESPPMNETNPHLTPAEIDRILGHARHPAPFAEAANAHLSECEQCRRALHSQAPAVEAQLLQLFARTESEVQEAKWKDSAKPESEWEETERAAEEWRQAQGAEDSWQEEDWGCIAQEDLSRYAADELSAPDKTRVETHLQECHLCRRDARELRELHTDAEKVFQSLAGSTAFAPPLAPPVTAPAPPLPVPDAAPAALPKADAPPNNDAPLSGKEPIAETGWQRRRAKWLPNFTLAPNSLVSFGVGAAFAAGVLIIGFLLPLRRQMEARDEARVRQATENDAKAALLQSDLEQARQREAQLTQQSQTQVAQLQKKVSASAAGLTNGAESAEAKSACRGCSSAGNGGGRTMVP